MGLCIACLVGGDYFINKGVTIFILVASLIGCLFYMVLRKKYAMQQAIKDFEKLSRSKNA